jgi:hypothetical protein
MSLRALGILAFLLALGCAHAPAQAIAPDWGIARASTEDTFEIGGQADHWGVKVTEDQILGLQPDFALARENGEIRGRAVGIPVLIGFRGDEGAGVYRAAPFTVKVERTPAGLHVVGLVGGALSDFELSTERINGRVGACGWDVRWNGTVYSGSRGCGMRIEPVSVSLPATMARWSDAEVAGTLGLLMNVGGVVPSDRLADNSAEFRNGPVSDPALVPYYRLGLAARIPARGGFTGVSGLSAAPFPGVARPATAFPSRAPSPVSGTPAVPRPPAGVSR